MLQQDAIEIVRQYVSNLNKGGISIAKAYLFGSYARNEANEKSDIDVLLVSTVFDTDDDVVLSKPWSPRFRKNFLIEPVAIGLERFQTDNESIILEIVRKEGLEIH